MADRRRWLHIFCEDVAHERFLQAVARRLSRDAGRPRPRLTTGSAIGGAGRALDEVRIHQTALARTSGAPDLLIVGIDANCAGWNSKKRQIHRVIDRDLFAAVALAVPDPHIERWFLCDPIALRDATGASITLPAVKCDRDLYKQMLTSALAEAGQFVTLGGAEFADEIVESMDFFSAGRSEPSLRHFIDDLRSIFKRWSA